MNVKYKKLIVPPQGIHEIYVAYKLLNLTHYLSPYSMAEKRRIIDDVSINSMPLDSANESTTGSIE